MRTVWVSFDTIGRDCLEAAAEAGADIVGVVTLPGPIDPNRSGQCAFDDIASRLDAALIETRDINSLETLNAIRKLEPELVFVVGWSQLVHDPFVALAREGVFGMHPDSAAAPPRSRADPVGDPDGSRTNRCDAVRDRRFDRRLGCDRRPGRRRHRARRDSHLSLRPAGGCTRPARARSDSTVAGAVRAARPPGPDPRQLVAEARSYGRHHRLGDARAVPLRLGAGADASLPGCVPRSSDGTR
jgi:hypothetical protein